MIPLLQALVLRPLLTAMIALRALRRNALRSILTALGPVKFGSSSLMTSLRLRRLCTHSLYSGRCPDANRAPTTAPMEVPAICTTS